MRFGTLYCYSHLFNVVFVSFTARVHRCCEWELTVAWLYIKPTLFTIGEFFFWRDVVHWLVDLIGYSTITSFHSSICLVFYLWIAIISLYYFNSYSTPYTLRKCSTLSHLDLFKSCLLTVHATGTTSTLLLIYVTNLRLSRLWLSARRVWTSNFLLFVVHPLHKPG